ncbi:hypothetical protein [Promicromonospora sp. MEB111]|uniref:hypothetical protein n=1 Tax=Promicromonospora sp. MEB111 TaxID=3040301 RepID=UPI00254A5791|nr:hypothetical protein [Promicromonospora sp. MEB111]
MTVVTISSKAGTDARQAGTADTVTKHAQALAALRHAEARTGVRKQATAARTAVQTVRAEQPGEPRRVQVRALRGGLSTEPASAVGDRSAASPAPSSGSRVSGAAGPGEGARVLPVHPHLATLLPDGGLRAGTTVAVRGSTSLLLTLLAEASRDGAWTVLVGYPAAGMAAAADAGCDLTRTLVVPLPAGSGVDAPAVLAALIDGMDVVVVGPEVALLDQDRRRLSARARERGTVLVPTAPLSAGYSPLQRPSTGRMSSTQRDAGDWAGAHVVLEATGGAWSGVDGGVGWLRRRTLRVRRTGRGSAARPVHLDVEVPVCRTGPGGLAGVRDGIENPGGAEMPAGAEMPDVVGMVAGDAEAPDEAVESRPPLELVG